jgi:hypothetical protein
VFDLGDLILRRRGDSATVTTGAGEPLHAATVGETTSNREAFLAVLDDALAHGHVTRYPHGDQPEQLRIAFYNPYTGHVAVGGLTASLSYGDDQPADIDRHGSVGVIDGDRLWCAGRAFRELTPQRAGLAAVWEAHQPL